MDLAHICCNSLLDHFLQVFDLDLDLSSGGRSRSFLLQLLDHFLEIFDLPLRDNRKGLKCAVLRW